MTNDKLSDDVDILYAIQILEKRLKQSTITTLTTPDMVTNYLTLRLGELEYELFGCLFLTIKNRLIKNLPMFRGSLSHGSVYPREVIKEALACNASAIIFYHNHPSGDVTPSAADRQITKQLQKACEIMDIRVLDHIIIAGTSYYSFSRQGII